MDHSAASLLPLHMKGNMLLMMTVLIFVVVRLCFKWFSAIFVLTRILQILPPFMIIF